jgi:hypothetical protein
MAMRTAMMAGAMLAALASAGVAQESTPPPSPEAQWTEFQSPERGFTVSFPSKPQLTSAAVTGMNPLIRYSFQASQVGEKAYTVVVLEYPDGKAPAAEDSLYLKMISAYAKDSQSKVRKRGPATIADHPGFEAITDDGKGKLNHLVDILPAGNRIYMLISAGPRGHATSDDALRFRNSFRLSGSGAPASPPTPSP